MIRMQKHELVFGVLSILFIFALFLRSSIAIITEDLMTDFVITATTLGLMSSTFFWTYGTFQIPIGVLSDRIGIRSTIIGFGLIGVSGSFLFAFSPTVQIATWARVLMGAGTAGIWIPILKYLSETYPAKEFATRTSIISSVGSLGFILSTLPMALLVESAGWRFTFNLVAILFLGVVILTWHLLGLHSSQNKNGSSAPQYFSFFKEKAFWYFAFWAFLTYGVSFSFQSLWGAAYLQNILGVTREIAGTHLMFTSLGLLFGGPFWGVLSDRFFRARRPVLFFCTLSLLLIWISFFLLSTYPGFFLISFLYFGIGFFSTAFLINFTCVKELLPLSIAGTSLGTLNTCMFLGVGFFQGITGFILDRSLDSGIAAYRSMFSFYIAGIFLALIIVLLVPETYLTSESRNSKQANVQ